VSGYGRGWAALRVYATLHVCVRERVGVCECVYAS